MSENSQREFTRPWLEMELASQLKPVSAPDDLWERINCPARAPVRPPAVLGFRFAPVPALAALLLVFSATILWSAHQRDGTPLTEQDLRVLADPSNGVAFPSDDPASIRKWVKANGNIDIEMPSNGPEGVRLLGAKLAQLRGTLFAAVAYRVGDDAATLLVSRKHSLFWNTASSKHSFSRTDRRAASLFSWTMRQQTYTIAYAGANDARSGCLLCHAGAHGLL